MGTCGTCRFWSELVAEARGTVLRALCEHPVGPKAGQMTREHERCSAWTEARLRSAR